MVMSVDLNSIQNEIARLKGQAADAMREDAPEACAMAREALLQLYRKCLRATGGLDLLRVPSRFDPWSASRRSQERLGAADFEELEWLCRVAAAGHIGAERLLDRALRLDRNSMIHRGWAQMETVAPLPWSPDAARFEVLAHEYPKVAQCFAMLECEKKDIDLPQLLYWLDKAGARSAGIADGIRELYPDLRHLTAGEAEILRLKVAGARAMVSVPGVK